MKSTMEKSQRHALILQRITRDGILAVAPVASEIGVSEETIRRDIKEMERQGLVRRRHGGAELPDPLAEPSWQERMRSNAVGKCAIGHAVARLVRPGDSLLIDAGTTNTFVAQALKDVSNLTVVTNSTDVARALAFRPDNDVYMAGGRLTSDDGASLGQSAIAFIAAFRVRLAIISAAAVHATDGIMAHKAAEAEFTRAAMGRADHVILVADRTKLDRTAVVRVAGLNAVQTFVTDASVPESLAEALASAGVTTVIAD
jgi:DeoR family glycerol-3-phosphate regulon repressor